MKTATSNTRSVILAKSETNKQRRLIINDFSKGINILLEKAKKAALKYDDQYLKGFITMLEAASPGKKKRFISPYGVNYTTLRQIPQVKCAEREEVFAGIVALCRVNLTLFLGCASKRQLAWLRLVTRLTTTFRGKLEVDVSDYFKEAEESVLDNHPHSPTFEN